MSFRRIVIVGGSLAGVHAAEELRNVGFDGQVLLLDADASAPHDRPPLSKQFLAGAWDIDQITLRTEGWYADLGIDLRLGCAATSLDLARRQVHTRSGEAFAYDGLIIATGSQPRWPVTFPSLPGMHALRTVNDAVALRVAFASSPRVAVIGGGFIGAEVASTARSLGLEVTLIESLSAPLAGAFGPVLGSVVGDIHRDHGVQLRCGVPVAQVEGDARVEGLLLADGTRVAADVVVVGVGAAPITDWLQSSGLPIDDGVVCDEFCATTAPGVMAAGDVARWHHPRLGSTRVEHHGNAVQQGAVAARNLLADSQDREPYSPVCYVWSDQYEHKIQTLGTCSPDDEIHVMHGSIEDRAFVAGFFRGGRLVGAMGLDARRWLMRTHPLIEEGASIETATETFPELVRSEAVVSS